MNNCSFLFFFFNDTATTEIYTLSLHDALPISQRDTALRQVREDDVDAGNLGEGGEDHADVGVLEVDRSEEHTSELQSRQYLVCRLLLEKKKKYTPFSLPPHPPPSFLSPSSY